MANNNQGFNNQNGQNPMNMNMYMNMQNEILKYVMEGMGEEPGDNYKDNMNFIYNYVPHFDYGDTSKVGSGKSITLTFQNNRIGISRITIGEDTQLSDVFKEYGRINNIDNINRYTFLYGGHHYNSNSNGTIKDKKFKENEPILVMII